MGAVMFELLGAVKDSLLRRRSERAQRLDTQMLGVGRWLLYLAFLWFAWKLYGFWFDELGPALVRADPSLAAEGVRQEQARESLFYIFAFFLAGPVVLLFAWVAVGFAYNLCRDTFTRMLPLTRHLLMPSLVVAAVLLADAHRGQLAGLLAEGYWLVELRIAEARGIRVVGR